MTEWTLKEVETLKEFYGFISNNDLANMMDKSKQSIQHKAHRLHLTVRKVATPKYCIDCNRLLCRSAWNIEKVQRCVSCANKKHSGAGHHNWRGGVASLRSLVHIALKHAWIDPILKRDNYTCQFCLKRGGDMHVHHIYAYRKIRDKVIKENADINIRTFEGRKVIALLIAEAHKLPFGITLCVPCHNAVHNEKRGELRETPNGNAEGNPQPSQPNVRSIVGWKVQRLTGEDSRSNKPDTSAAASYPMRHEIV